MPELPEVEVTARGIATHLLGKVLQSCTVKQPQLRWPIPDTVMRCQQQRLCHVGRRSKYLCMQFECDIVIVHLGMSGALKILKPNTPWAKHDHIEWNFGDILLRLNDPRRFGSVEHTPLIENWQIDYPRFKNLGPEPFSEQFTADALFASTRNKNTAIKVHLMSGHAVVGVGNIYASEALFRSGIRPGRAGKRIAQHEAHRLHQSILEVLNQAIEAGGSSLRDFKGVEGEFGCFQTHCDVYQRDGLPCHVCQTPIKKKILGNRSTFYCPTCQQ